MFRFLGVMNFVNFISGLGLFHLKMRCTLRKPFYIDRHCKACGNQCRTRVAKTIEGAAVFATRVLH